MAGKGVEGWAMVVAKDMEGRVGGMVAGRGVMCANSGRGDQRACGSGLGAISTATCTMCRDGFFAVPPRVGM